MSLRQWLYRHGVRYHAQNLNERPGSSYQHKLLGPMWRYGRAWVNFFRSGPEDKWTGDWLEINPEWNVKPQASAGLGVQLGGGDGQTDIMLWLDVALARFYLTLDSPLWKRWLERILPGYWFQARDLGPEPRYQHFDKPAPGRLKVTQEVEVSLRYHDDGLWWSLWQPTMEWKAGTPWWRYGHFNFVDFLLGRQVYSSQPLETVDVEVPMPEGVYHGTVQMSEDTWRRPRWPFAKRMLCADIEVPDGVPHPGKGENSWDCGEDATYGLCCVARSPEQAVAKLVESVLESRRRHGGRNWRPQEKTLA